MERGRGGERRGGEGRGGERRREESDKLAAHGSQARLGWV